MKNILEAFQEFELQLELPIYQRDYDWSKEDCLLLIKDIILTAEENKNGLSYKHFLGNILVKGNKLIDGQQRLTTLTLILLVIKNRFGIKTFTNFPLLLTRDNQTILEMILNDKVNLNDVKSNIIVNYFAIKKSLELDFTKDEINDLVTYGLKNTVLHFQYINGAEYDENMIFETLNSRGKPLSSYDLIKADLLRNQAYKELENYNSRIELKTSSKPDFDEDEMINLFRDYLVLKTGKLNAKTTRDTKGDSLNKAFKKYFTDKEYYAELLEIEAYFSILRKISNTSDFLTS